MNQESLKSTIEKLYKDILINLDVEKINMYFALLLIFKRQIITRRILMNLQITLRNSKRLWLVFPLMNLKPCL